MIRDIYDKAKAIDKTLLSTDPRFNGVVSVYHMDGSFFEFHHAFIVKYREEKQENFWYLVFSEHHGYHIYYSEDVKIYQFGPIIIPEELKNEK